MKIPALTVGALLTPLIMYFTPLPPSPLAPLMAAERALSFETTVSPELRAVGLFKLKTALEAYPLPGGIFVDTSSVPARILVITPEDVPNTARGK